MKKIALLSAVILMSSISTFALAGEHRIGVGTNYWHTIDDIDEDSDFDKNGLSIIGSYQYWYGILGTELDVEVIPNYFDETAVTPTAYILVGKGIYAGAGIGIMYADGDFADEPYFALKAGLNIEILPSIYADINANYRFDDGADMNDDDKDIDTDTIFFGAAIRYAF